MTDTNQKCQHCGGSLYAFTDEEGDAGLKCSQCSRTTLKPRPIMEYKPVEARYNVQARGHLPDNWKHRRPQKQAEWILQHQHELVSDLNRFVNTARLAEGWGMKQGTLLRHLRSWGVISGQGLGIIRLTDSQIEQKLGIKLLGVNTIVLNNEQKSSVNSGLD